MKNQNTTTSNEFKGKKLFIQNDIPELPKLPNYPLTNTRMYMYLSDILDYETGMKVNSMKDVSHGKGREKVSGKLFNVTMSCPDPDLWNAIMTITADMFIPRDHYEYCEIKEHCRDIASPIS